MLFCFAECDIVCMSVCVCTLLSCTLCDLCLSVCLCVFVCLCSSLESAPLSSTLIEDWRFVTGDMDASEWEAALQEMDAPRFTLTDLTNSRYLSP